MLQRSCYIPNVVNIHISHAVIIIEPHTVYR